MGEFFFLSGKVKFSRKNSGKVEVQDMVIDLPLTIYKYNRCVEKQRQSNQKQQMFFQVKIVSSINQKNKN